MGVLMDVYDRVVHNGEIAKLREDITTLQREIVINTMLNEALRGENEMNLKTIVQNNNPATISFYRSGNVFYNVVVDGQTYSFPVSLEDIGGASLMATEKAITLMRYIRKALADGTFVRA